MKRLMILAMLATAITGCGDSQEKEYEAFCRKTVDNLVQSGIMAKDAAEKEIAKKMTEFKEKTLEEKAKVMESIKKLMK